VESWTTPFGRDGLPEKAFLAVRTPDGSRTWGLISDADEAAATVAADIAGRDVVVRSDGRVTVRG